MKSIDTRDAALEQTIGRHIWSPNIVACGVRAQDEFVCGYFRVKTGESVSQGEGESDADFVVRAQAAGFVG